MWNAVQCAVRGRGHEKTDIPCQDKTAFAAENGVQVIALADGAGSAKLSHYGAEAVTRHICSLLCSRFGQYFSNKDGVSVKQELLDETGGCLRSLADQLGCEVKKLASSLLFVAVCGEHFIMAHIGDGVIGYLKNGELKVASQPENGEFANTTVFTTSREALLTMRLFKGSLGPIQGFVLMSDGTEASLYDKREHRLAAVLKRIMDMTAIIPPAKVEEQLKQSFEQVVKAPTTDDCSIALLTCVRKDFSGYAHLSHAQKCRLLQINPLSPKRRLRRYDQILCFLQESRTLTQTARRLCLKPKYAKRYLDRLQALSLVEKEGLRYHTLLILEKS